MKLKIGLVRNIQLSSVEITTQDQYFLSSSNSDFKEDFRLNSKLNIKSNQNKVQIFFDDQLLVNLTLYIRRKKQKTLVFLQLSERIHPLERGVIMVNLKFFQIKGN